jgi:hypothetical protein
MLIRNGFAIGIILLYIISTVTPIIVEKQGTGAFPNVPALNTYENSATEPGLILYTPMLSTNTYLVNRDGTVLTNWQSNYFPGLSAYLLPNGNLLRPKRLNFEPGASGGIQEFSPDGTLIWDYTYYSYGEYMTHHDVKPLPNGNVLALSHISLSYSELVTLGRNPSNVLPGGMKLEKILEIKPTGPTSGDIVWEWCSADHLIQDYDPTKLNYGVVGDHPELIDINYYDGLDEDLFHCNSIDYNQELDKILISCRNFNELWIINHSTGDLIYRWGNPETYRADGEQELFWQHDATWIKPDYPGAGHLLVFNNGVGRGFSSVDEIDTSVGTIVWSYTHQNFLSAMYCGAARLQSGNTLICDSDYGTFFEVTPDGTTVWQYQAQDYNGKVFKIDYILPNENQVDCIGSLSWNDIEPNSTVTGSFIIRNKGQTPLVWNISEYPEWGTWGFSASGGIVGEEVNITVTVVVPTQEDAEFEGFIKVISHDNQEDYDIVPIYLQTPLKIQSEPSTVVIKSHIPYFILRNKICR